MNPFRRWKKISHNTYDTAPYESDILNARKKMKFSNRKEITLSNKRKKKNIFSINRWEWTQNQQHMYVKAH